MSDCLLNIDNQVLSQTETTDLGKVLENNININKGSLITENNVNINKGSLITENNVQAECVQVNSTLSEKAKHSNGDINYPAQELNSVSAKHLDFAHQKIDCEKDDDCKSTYQSGTPHSERSERDVPLSTQNSNTEQTQKTLSGKGLDLNSQCLYDQRKTLVKNGAFYCNKSSEDGQQTQTDENSATLLPVSAESIFPVVGNNQAVCVNKVQEGEVTKKVPCISNNVKFNVQSKENDKEKFNSTSIKRKRKKKRWNKKKMFMGQNSALLKQRQFLAEQKEMLDEPPGSNTNPRMWNPTADEYNACVWILAKNSTLSIQQIYDDHFNWFRKLNEKNSQVLCHSYSEYVNLVKFESNVAIVFNKHTNVNHPGLSSPVICKNWPDDTTEINDVQLSFLLARSPLFKYHIQDLSWRKCFLIDGQKEDAHWQGILYMRKVWAGLGAYSINQTLQEYRSTYLKLYINGSTPKSVVQITGAISRSLHIPSCEDLGKMVCQMLKDLRVQGVTAEVNGVDNVQPGKETSITEVADMQPVQQPCSKGVADVQPGQQSSDDNNRTSLTSSNINVQDCSVVQSPKTCSNFSSLNKTDAHIEHSYSAELIQNSEISSVPVSASANEIANCSKNSLPKAVSSSKSISNTEKSMNNDSTCLMEVPMPSGSGVSVQARVTYNTSDLTTANLNPISQDVQSSSDSIFETVEEVIRKAMSDPSPSKPTVKRKCLKRGPHTPAPSANEQYYLPLKMGWVREVVTRAISEVGKISRDVYYHPHPKGKKLRSMVDVEKYLEKEKDTKLKIENFTFYKESLGFGPPFELIRNANLTRDYFKRKNEGDEGASPEKKKIKVPKTSSPKNSTNLNLPTSSNANLPADHPKKNKKSEKAKPKGNQGVGLNDSWSDEVPITNEMGETTGFEDAIWINKGNVNTNHTQGMHSVRKPLTSQPGYINNSGYSMQQKNYHKQTSMLRQLKNVRHSSQTNNVGVSKATLDHGLYTRYQYIPSAASSHLKKEEPLSGIKSNPISTSNNCWLDIIDQYVKRKRKLLGNKNIQTMRSDSQTLTPHFQSLIQCQVGDETLPVISSVQSESNKNMVSHMLNEKPLQLWHLPVSSNKSSTQASSEKPSASSEKPSASASNEKPKAPVSSEKPSENSVSRIRVRPFSELLASTSVPGDQSIQESNNESSVSVTNNVVNENNIPLMNSENSVVEGQSLMQSNNPQLNSVTVPSQGIVVMQQKVKVKKVNVNPNAATESNSKEVAERSLLSTNNHFHQPSNIPTNKFPNIMPKMPMSNNQTTPGTSSSYMTMGTTSTFNHVPVQQPPSYSLSTQQQFTPVLKTEIPMQQITTSAPMWQPNYSQFGSYSQNNQTGQQTTYRPPNVYGQHYSNVAANYYLPADTQQPTNSIRYVNQYDTANVAGPSQYPQGNSQNYWHMQGTGQEYQNFYTPMQSNVNNGSNYNANNSNMFYH